MRFEEHSSETVCRALGLFGFANDPLLLQPKRSLRMLIQPAQEPEMCLTLSAEGKQARLAMVVARARLFDRPGANVPKDRATCMIDPARFESICELVKTAASAVKTRDVPDSRVKVHMLLTENGKRIDLEEGLHANSPLKPAVQAAIADASDACPDPICRQALSVLGELIKEDLPRHAPTRSTPANSWSR